MQISRRDHLQASNPDIVKHCYIVQSAVFSDQLPLSDSPQDTAPTHPIRLPARYRHPWLTRSQLPHPCQTTPWHNEPAIPAGMPVYHVMLTVQVAVHYSQLEGVASWSQIRSGRSSCQHCVHEAETPTAILADHCCP